MDARITAICLATLSMLSVSPVRAQPNHSDARSGHDAHEHAPTNAAKTLATALHEIHERMNKLDALLAEGHLDAAHDESDMIGVLAKSLGALALKPDSGIPRSSVKDINKAGKALAEASDGVHEAGEKNDLGAAKAAFTRMKSLAQTLANLAPTSEPVPSSTDRYACPMHDEGDKTYDKPGKCPVCGMTLKRLTTDAFSAVVNHREAEIQPGKPTMLSIALRDPAGTPVTSLETVHEKTLHLLIVSNDLSWFTHEHPTLQPDGTFTLTYTFPHAGDFTLYHDFSPTRVGQQVVQVPIAVGGTTPESVPLVADEATPKVIDGYTVSVQFTTDGGGPTRTGTDTHLSFTIAKGGTPVTTLLPYLGAMGHLVIISSDRSEFVHSHPHESDSGNPAGRASDPARTGGPKIDFEAHFKSPGTYKAWGQFNIGTLGNEKVLTAPFTFVVAKGTEESTPHEHTNHEHKQ